MGADRAPAHAQRDNPSSPRMQKILHDNFGLLSWMPRLEGTTFDVSFVHFLLMFGYKLFSLFYPLYLASVGISLVSIGNIYFLTYAIISVGCLAMNYYIHKVNPARLAALGILGYGLFAFLMLLSQDLGVLYLAQMVLGLSAAAWLVSLKFILMNAKTESRAASFGWFYSMPTYATALAPAVGGLIIWKFGFPGVFLASLVIQLCNAAYAYLRLRRNPDALSYRSAPAQPAGAGQWRRYRAVLGLLNDRRNVLVMLSFIFATLVLGGIYRAFFVLLLEDIYGSQAEAIKFASAAAFMYVPCSILAIRLMGVSHKTRLVGAGIAAEGLAAAVLGVFYSALSLGAIFLLNVLDSMGALVMGAGKSAFFAKKLDQYKEEASTIDSVLTTLGPAVGGFVGGIGIACWGYRMTFALAGALVLVMGVYSFLLRFEERRAE